MTRRRDCTCAGTAPGYPQHEWWCGKPEPADDPLHPLHHDGVFEEAVGVRREKSVAGETAAYEERWGIFRQPEPPPDELVYEPVDDRLVVELHSVPTTGGDEQKPSLSDCLKANGVPREQWATVSAAVAVWMRAWFHDVLDDEPDPDGAA